MKKVVTLIIVILSIISVVLADYFDDKTPDGGSPATKVERKTYSPKRTKTPADKETKTPDSKEAKTSANKEASTKSNQAMTYKELLPAVPSNWSSKVKDVVRHKYFTLLYDTRHNTPAWVAWRLTSAHTTGSEKRSQKFWADPLIPKEYRVDYYDYRNEWDRGHMCPAGDNKWDKDAMYECFYMSNMCPQNHKLNSGPWGSLENACRNWARTEGSIYIVCGPVYKNCNQGRASCRHQQIGVSHKVYVPEAFFKAVVSLRKGHEKAIAFYFTNDDNNPSYRKLAMSVDEIEQICGYDLFANLDDRLENRIEATFNINDWKK